MVSLERRRRIAGRHRSGIASGAASVIVAIVFITIAARGATPDAEWSAAFAAARQQQKLVFIDYYATWCRPCAVMDANVFPRGDVKQELAKFIVLRIDVDHSSIGRTRGVVVMPTYVVYDPSQRELFRIVGAKPPMIFRDALATINSVQPEFLHAAELTDGGKPIEGAFALANIYLRLRLLDNARAALAGAQKLANDGGKPETAQAAAVQDAVIYSLQGNPKKAMRLIEDILRKPVSAEVEALGWLSLGDVAGAAKDLRRAREAYEHVKTIAKPNSASYQQADAALKALSR